MNRTARNRRQVGGYEWVNELDEIAALGQTLTTGLVELGKNARSVETANLITRYVSISAAISVKALELQD